MASRLLPSLGSSRLYRLGVSQAQKANESGDEYSQMAPPHLTAISKPDSVQAGYQGDELWKYSAEAT